nr:hypothetical protein K-LCC10_0503 [Kaumoebavirus]
MDIVAEIMSKTPETYWRGMLLNKEVRRIIRAILPKFRAVRQWSMKVEDGTILPNGSYCGVKYGDQRESFILEGEPLYDVRMIGDMKLRTTRGFYAGWSPMSGQYRRGVNRVEKDFIVQITDNWIYVEDRRSDMSYLEKPIAGGYVLEYWEESRVPYVKTETYAVSRIWKIFELFFQQMFVLWKEMWKCPVAPHDTLADVCVRARDHWGITEIFNTALIDPVLRADMNAKAELYLGKTLMIWPKSQEVQAKVLYNGVLTLMDIPRHLKAAILTYVCGGGVVKYKGNVIPGEHELGSYTDSLLVIEKVGESGAKPGINLVYSCRGKIYIKNMGYTTYRRPTGGPEFCGDCGRLSANLISVIVIGKVAADKFAKIERIGPDVWVVSGKYWLGWVRCES